MNTKQFMEREHVGMILRAFATKPDQVPGRLEMVKEAVDRVGTLKIDGKPLTQRIDVLVWADKNYKEADCGITATVLREKFRNVSSLFVSEVPHGDLYCGLLNYGIAHQLRHGCDYSIIASAEAFSYMTPETMAAVVDAACKGAKAIGVAISELTDSILAGRISNTFAMWRNESLMTVGGFDLRAAKPPNDFSAHYMKGWSPWKNEWVFYQLAGVEEMVPLARLVETFGPCIAPILPQGEGVQRYQVPNPVKNPDLWERHVTKMGTKLERQSALLAMVGYDPSFLLGGVMEEYRNQK